MAYGFPHQDPHAVEVGGSWGIMAVNRWTGDILIREDWLDPQCPDEVGYTNILRFNPYTLKGHTDILDTGFFYRKNDGSVGYEPPLDPTARSELRGDA